MPAISHLTKPLHWSGDEFPWEFDVWAMDFDALQTFGCIANLKFPWQTITTPLPRFGELADAERVRPWPVREGPGPQVC